MTATAVADVALMHGVEDFSRDVHAHTELSVTEHNQTGLGLAWLRDFGLPVHRGLGSPCRRRPSPAGQGALTQFPADMDALPFEWATGLP